MLLEFTFFHPFNAANPNAAILRDSKPRSVCLDVMFFCLDTEYSDDLCAELVDATQDILNSVWLRMKREAGIKQRHEIRIANGLKKERKAKEYLDQFHNAM